MRGKSLHAFGRLAAEHRKRVDLGLDPRSYISACDVCGRRTLGKGRESHLIQQGPWMVHRFCLDRNRQLFSLRRPKLNYGAIQLYPSEPAEALVVRMQVHLDADRRQQIETLKVFYEDGPSGVGITDGRRGNGQRKRFE